MQDRSWTKSSETLIVRAPKRMFQRWSTSTVASKNPWGSIHLFLLFWEKSPSPSTSVCWMLCFKVKINLIVLYCRWIRRSGRMRCNNFNLRIASQSSTVSRSGRVQTGEVFPWELRRKTSVRLHSVFCWTTKLHRAKIRHFGTKNTPVDYSEEIWIQVAVRRSETGAVMAADFEAKGRWNQLACQRALLLTVDFRFIDHLTDELFGVTWLPINSQNHRTFMQ